MRLFSLSAARSVGQLLTRTALGTLLLSLTLAAPASVAHAQATGKTQLEWYGHAAFKITTPTGKVVLIDPWLTNPLNKTGAADVAALTKADLILISHGHGDHVGDAVKLAQQTKARLVSSFDLGQALTKYAGYPADLAQMDTQGNVGGQLVLLDGEVMVQFTPAVHGSTVSDAQQDLHAAGSPGGFLVSIKGGPTFYHTGDTGLFSDMALLPKVRKIDVMLCCIGDHFVMGPEQAAEAVKLVNPTTVVPMHYGTFPVLTGTAEAFQSELKKKGSKVKVEVLPVHGKLTL